MPSKSIHQATCFTPFSSSIDDFSLPERFTFPFYYQPHPLCILAAQELQHHLQTQTQWQHNFGFTDDKELIAGKMFGVLLVQKPSGDIGYLSAFSGKLADDHHHDKFVPPVFDLLAKDGFFIKGQLEINQINATIERLEKYPLIAKFQQKLTTELKAYEADIEAQRNDIIAGRQSRKAQRDAAKIALNADDFQLMQKKLSQESINEKNQLRDLKIFWDEVIGKITEMLLKFTDEIALLKNKRKSLSADLQEKLFQQYRFLNINGEERDLKDIFSETVMLTPPAGAGACAAPKLLQHAFKLGLKPLAIAEFWWGESPKSEIRQHGNFYPACQGKCKPILAHMLAGMNVDDNPLLTNPGIDKIIDIIYQDEVMAIINKPAEFLSVPGKNITDCVYSRMNALFPSATGPLIVHRLDMSTSGLMVIALTKNAHKNLQKQFINRTVKKRYVALIDGILEQEDGVINLPLRGDFYDRPRQLVCEEYGKPAETTWHVLERNHHSLQTKVYLYPKTGRTHQLRVHCAHHQGLHMPIIGDDLYGITANRLHLHAQLLTLEHPVTKALLNFEVDADF